MRKTVGNVNRPLNMSAVSELLKVFYTSGPLTTTRVQTGVPTKEPLVVLT